jgi:galactokinase
MAGSSFDAIFGLAPKVVAHAPGRVNMLGEHTDYNEGFVLPTAIPLVTTVELAPSRDGDHHLYAARLEAMVRYTPGGEMPDGFARYVLGCLAVLAEHGHDSGPLRLRIDSEVPIGAGLSSSAALEIAVLRAVRELKALPLDDVELALMAQQAEIRFAQVRCGIMDQMAASLAHPGEMLFLDTRSLERALLPFPAGSEFVVIDSGIPRALAGSAYNRRRAECEEAARWLGVAALRDVAGLDAVSRLPEPLNRRARHVFTENARVLEAARGVSAARFGELMNASHASLRDDFEVSVAGLDALVALLQAHPDVYGARLTGAGFGGACVALIASGRAGKVGEDVLKDYSGRGRVLV